MKNTSKPIQIRDARRRQMYRIDDRYLDGYAKLCAPAGTAVYNSLCRHADTKQESWPSIDLICDQHGISKSTAIRALKKLEEWNIIAVERKRDPRTKRQMVNVYVLIDQVDWKRLPGVTREPGPGVVMEPGAGCQKNAEPGVKNDQKPGVTTVLEGGTEEKEAHRRVVADATDPAPTEKKCKQNGCNKTPVKDREFCKEHQLMTCPEFVEWYRKSEKRYIKLIAEFADEVKPVFETIAQWELWAAAHYKAAQELAVFSDEQIEKAYREVKASKYITEFNLYTVKKFVLNTKNQ